MQKVWLGLAFYYAKILSYLLFVAFPFIGLFILLPGLALLGRDISLVLLVLGGAVVVFVILSPLAGAVGSFLCLWGMLRFKGTLTLAISLALDVLTFALLLLFLATFAPETAGEGPPEIQPEAVVLLALGAAVNVAAWVSLMAFLRRLAVLVEGENAVSTDQIPRLILFGLALLVLIPGAIIGLTALVNYFEGYRSLTPVVAYAGALAWLVASVNFLVANLRLIAHLREAVQAKLPS